MDSYINTLSDLFFQNHNPMIIMDRDGSNCILNKESTHLYDQDTYETIFQLFPDLILDETNPEQKCRDIINEHLVELDLKYFRENRQWVLNINKTSLDWAEFNTHKQLLHIIFLELISITDEKELYKVLVERVLKHLKIDRIGILLYDQESQTVQGSWGTDDKANVVDQSDYKINIDTNSNAQEALALHHYTVFEEGVPLSVNGKIFGTGWNSTTAFFAGNKPIGWITCDNAINQKPLTNWLKEIINEISRMTGELVFHLRVENHLKEKIEKKTKELEDTISTLKLTQENLIESEKMASLGSLVAGVSHEINTPVGIALTMTSHITEKSTEIEELFLQNRLKKRELQKFIKDSKKGSEIAVSSLHKAADLINSFKQLAVTKNTDMKQDFSLFDICNNAILSFQYSHDLNKIKIINSIPENISIYSYPMDYYQIFTNLICNSLFHAFDKNVGGIITITGILTNDKLEICYKDNGVGIPGKLHKKVFDPFFTTTRSSGGTGLGLNIIYNTILKLGGNIELTNNKPKGTHFTLNFDLGLK